MKKAIILLLASIGFANAFAQNIGIGTNTPHASAMLDVTSTNKGLLVPRVAMANRPASPATGLLIYQTDNTPGFYYYNGSAWQMLGGGSGFTLPYTGSTAGNALNITSTDGIGITGASTAASGNWYGGQFTSASTAGSGVYGAATAATGTTFGGQFATLSTSGRGVYGGATAATGETFGGYFLSQSSSGRGVYGLANASTGLTRGGQFESNSTTGTGVYGIALSTSGDARGGEFVSNSTGGRGVYGEAISATGATRGGEFVTNSSSGTGVVGYANSHTGLTFGVYGRSNGYDGVGVSGLANAATGYNIGVHGRTNSIEGSGVVGSANATTGVNYGVYGNTYSPNGVGGIFQNNSSNEGLALRTAQGAVEFNVLGGIGTRMVVANSSGRLSTQDIAGGQWATSGNNVYNSNSGNVGIGINNPIAKLTVVTENNYSVLGENSNTQGTGVFGRAIAATGFTTGVNGVSYSINGKGVVGVAEAITGTAHGVWGSTKSNQGTGVSGWADNLTGLTYGVYGFTNSTDGRGVSGVASSVSGITFGITGESNSPGGFGGFFYNNAAGVALKTTTGHVEFDALSGTGNRMVVANNTGRLSTQPLGVSISTAFQVITTAANTTFNTTRLSYPNPSINDMVTVTPVWIGTYLISPIGVFFNQGEWWVFRQDDVDMPLGVKFNVIVIKQ